MKQGLRAVLFCILLFFSFSVFAADDLNSLPNKVKAFINYMVKRYHFDRQELTRLFSQIHYNEDVVNHVTHPYEEKPWNLYREHFITPQRVTDGVRYWRAHEAVLQYAYQHYGVPPSLIVSIIGIETNYGEHVGDYSALTALSTLAFHHQSRTEFFTKELEQLFLLAQEQQMPIAGIKSSYAGALGIPQFMPSTYRHYAVKYNSSQPIDLINNNNDAIVSIANYLAQNGWRVNEPIVCNFSNRKPIPAELISKRAIPQTTSNMLKKIGITPAIPIASHQKVAIIELRNENSREQWLAFHNFRVIMSYNPRIIYSMAIYQLSTVLQKSHDEQMARESTATTPARIAKRSARNLSSHS